MAANLPRPSTEENISSTLSSGISDVAVTVTIGDASKLVAPCYLVIDRVDSAGVLKSASQWEYVKVTNIAGNDLTVTRGVNGSSAQSHSAGAIIEAVVTSAHFEDWYAALNPEHDSTGGHVIVGTMTIAGMNLASQATVAAGTFGHLRANASTSGLGLAMFPTFVIPNNASAATVSVGKPLVLPRGGDFKFVNVTLRAPISGASLIIDINNNFTSIFDPGTRPFILGGGTFVSTASIKTPHFSAGNTLSVDLDAGGNYKDATVILAAY